LPHRSKLQTPPHFEELAIEPVINVFAHIDANQTGRKSM
jgi:hypothetical protein